MWAMPLVLPNWCLGLYLTLYRAARLLGKRSDQLRDHATPLLVYWAGGTSMVIPLPSSLQLFQNAFALLEKGPPLKAAQHPLRARHWDRFVHVRDSISKTLHPRCWLFWLCSYRGEFGVGVDSIGGNSPSLFQYKFTIMLSLSQYGQALTFVINESALLLSPLPRLLYQHPKNARKHRHPVSGGSLWRLIPLANSYGMCRLLNNSRGRRV